MPNYHSAPIRLVRELARKVGLLPWLRRLLVGGDYEEAFGRALAESVRPGDVVWDVGANVGYYTAKFLEQVGGSGTVVAFEPLTAARAELTRNLATHPAVARLKICGVALADRDGESFMEFEATGEAVTTTAHLVQSASATARTERVEVLSANSALVKLELPRPVVTKVDVEGYELEVVMGASEVFGSASSCHVFIEMHFARMAARGLHDAPGRIVGQLKAWGYQVRWLDPSHLHAFRAATG